MGLAFQIIDILQHVIAVYLIIMLAYMTTFGARISISVYNLLSVYEMASKIFARCARGPLLEKNIVKL